MTDDQFWSIIEQSRDGVPSVGLDNEVMDRQLAKMTMFLEALTPEEIVAFDTVMGKVHRRSNLWDLWGVAYIIMGGCSDDAFEYFRRWLLAQGRETFERAVREPDSLAEIIPSGLDHEMDFEEFFHLADDVYGAKTGNELADLRLNWQDTGPQGDTWTEEDLPKRFPKTWANFGWQE